MASSAGCIGGAFSVRARSDISCDAGSNASPDPSARRNRPGDGELQRRGANPSAGCPLVRIAARRITLRSSRTLPGQSAAAGGVASARGGSSSRGPRPRARSRCRKCAGPGARCHPQAFAERRAAARRCRPADNRGRGGSEFGLHLALEIAQGHRDGTRTGTASHRPRRPGAGARIRAPAAARVAGSSGSSPISSSTRRPARGLLEPAGPGAGHSAREGAALVTEELALGQLARQRPAVYRHERAARIRSQLVQRARQQLLAGAALARDQNGCAGVGRDQRRARQRRAQT